MYCFPKAGRGLIVGVFCLCGAVAFLTGCAARYTYSYPGHKTFTHDNLSRIHVGMSSEEIRATFGEPDEQYVGEFGADTDTAWTGQVWIYFTELDKNLRYVKRYKKNVFVFYPAEGDMRLNHWEIEK